MGVRGLAGRFGGAKAVGGSWVRAVEQLMFRFGSLCFSLASAYAIQWFFSPLGGGDPIERVLTWVVAGCFGMLGFFVCRGLTHRLMHRESIWGYLPICMIVEFVEIFCNFARAASQIKDGAWFQSMTGTQHTVAVVFTYAVWSAIPMVSIFLAVVDMDLERRRSQGGSAGPSPQASWGARPSPKGPQRPAPAPFAPTVPAPKAAPGGPPPQNGRKFWQPGAKGGQGQGQGPVEPDPLATASQAW